MTITTPHRAHLIKPSRFGYLMDLYAENFARFHRTFPLQSHLADHWRSSVDDGLDLHLDVIERHRYTTEIRLTYDLADPSTGAPEPSAYLRMYHDARLIEVTHCHLDRRWQEVLGLRPSLATLIGHRMRMNTFLWKWLDYLSDQGHSPYTLSLRGSLDDPRASGKLLLT